MDWKKSEAENYFDISLDGSFCLAGTIILNKKEVVEMMKICNYIINEEHKGTRNKIGECFGFNVRELIDDVIEYKENQNVKVTGHIECKCGKSQFIERTIYKSEQDINETEIYLYT